METTQFQHFRRAILERAARCGGEDVAPVRYHRRHSEAVIAAAAQVVANHEPGWCEAHPAEFQEEIWANLSLMTRIASWLLAIFVPGGPIWLTVIGWVLPVVIDWLATEEAAALCGAAGEDLGQQAQEFLKTL